MTTAHGSISRRQHSIGSWILSLVIHGCVVTAAWALVTEIKPPTPEEIFKWDVSVVVPAPQPPEPAQPSPSPAVPDPPKPRPVKTPKPVEPMKQEPAVQARETPVETLQPVQEVRAVQETQPIQEVQPVQDTQPVREIQPVQETKPIQESQPVQTAQAVQPTTQEQAAVTRPVQEATPSTHEVAQAMSRPQTPVETAPVVSTAEPSVASQEVVRSAVESAPGPVVSEPRVAERSVVEAAQPSTEQAAKVEQTLVARAAPVTREPTIRQVPIKTRETRPDYGWLSQALWANVDQRKRYPREAKRNRLEGKVILRLTIEQRGAGVHLVAIHLQESSGHAILDRHTVDMVQKAFPLEVAHRLAQPRIQVDLPFTYRME